MKKIVINNCFGGFSLSPLAVKRMAELNGRKCYFFTKPVFNGPYVLTKIEDLENSLFWSAFDIEDANFLRTANWHEMSDKEKEENNNLYAKHSLDKRDIERDDPMLIQVIEELGEMASGKCTKLKIIKIPDDVEWEIEEYDGLEHVAEKHRTWE